MGDCIWYGISSIYICSTNGGVSKGGQAYRDIFTQGQARQGAYWHDEITSTFKHLSMALARLHSKRMGGRYTADTSCQYTLGGWKVRPGQVSFFHKPTTLSLAHHSPDTIGYLAGTNMLLHNGLTAYIDFFLDPQEETTSRFRPAPAAPAGQCDTTPFRDPEHLIGPGDLNGLLHSPCR